MSCRRLATTGHAPVALRTNRHVQEAQVHAMVGAYGGDSRLQALLRLLNGGRCGLRDTFHEPVHLGQCGAAFAALLRKSLAELIQIPMVSWQLTHGRLQLQLTASLSGGAKRTDLFLEGFNLAVRRLALKVLLLLLEGVDGIPVPSHGDFKLSKLSQQFCLGCDERCIAFGGLGALVRRRHLNAWNASVQGTDFLMQLSDGRRDLHLLSLQLQSHLTLQIGHRSLQ
mmetsp:Transcript_134474/g.190122  ORF Transcript_134474/g.190122 Transcript_134474/m.190122 type:complete len:226 (+) Transcript_134474:1092-1769(+)